MLIISLLDILALDILGLDILGLDILGMIHPNIFAWIEFIQREEAVTKAMCKIQSFRSGATAQPQRHRMKEKRIQTLFDHFNAGPSTNI